MSCVSITLLLCLATMLLAHVTCQISGVSNCPCLKTSNRVPRKEQIESYMIQKAPVCHIDAVLFKTVSGRFICADPLKAWRKLPGEFVDKKKKAVKMTANPINAAPTFTTASTPDTASDWNGQDELRTTAPELLEFVNTSIGRLLCTCLKTSEAVLHKEDIKSYKIHKADICHIDAIEFKTVSSLNFLLQSTKALGGKSHRVCGQEVFSLRNNSTSLKLSPIAEEYRNTEAQTQWF